jgi:hypothetical protein
MLPASLAVSGPRQLWVFWKQVGRPEGRPLIAAASLAIAGQAEAAWLTYLAKLFRL